MKTKEKLYSLGLVSLTMISFLILISSTASAFPVTYSVVGTNYECNSWSNEQYPSINLFGTKYVPLFADDDPIWKCHVNKLSKLVLDSGEKYTLTSGEKIDLGQGYSLELKQVDVDGNKVWLQFAKDGLYIDDQIIEVDGICTCKLNNVQGVDDVPVLKAHVAKIIVGAKQASVLIDGIWLIDYQNAWTLKIGDKIGNLKLKKIVNGTDVSNLGSLTFEKNSKFPVAAFSASPIIGKAPLKVKFTDESTGSPTSWKWDFGDGTYSTAKNPVHKYTKAGKYTISLTANNVEGNNTKKISNYVTVKRK
jgi:S-layer protein (TIGR01567 family)